VFAHGCAFRPLHASFRDGGRWHALSRLGDVVALAIFRLGVVVTLRL
jgi:hypothetical protein